MNLTWTNRSLTVTQDRVRIRLTRPYPNPEDPRWIASPYPDGTQGRFIVAGVYVDDVNVSLNYSPSFQIKIPSGWVGGIDYGEYLSTAVVTSDFQSAALLAPDQPGGTTTASRISELVQSTILVDGGQPFAYLHECFSFLLPDWIYRVKLLPVREIPFEYMYLTGFSSDRMSQFEWGRIGDPPEVIVVNEPIPESVYTKRVQGFDCLRARYDWGSWSIMGHRNYENAGYDAHFGPSSVQEGRLSAWYVPEQMFDSIAMRKLSTAAFEYEYRHCLELTP